MKKIGFLEERLHQQEISEREEFIALLQKQAEGISNTEALHVFLEKVNQLHALVASKFGSAEYDLLCDQRDKVMHAFADRAKVLSQNADFMASLNQVTSTEKSVFLLAVMNA